MGHSAEEGERLRSSDEPEQDAGGTTVEATEPTPRGQSDGDGTPTIPEELPVLPARDVVVFPGTVVPLSVGREKSKRLIDAVLAGDKTLTICTQRHVDVEDPGIDDIYRIGTAANVLKLLRMPDGTNSLLVHGIARIGIEEMLETEPYWRARVNSHFDETKTESLELKALAHSARRTAEQVIELSPNVPDEARMVLDSIEEPGPLADYLAANLSLGVAQKQELLETFDVADRLRKVNATLNNQLEVLQLSQKIQTDVRQEIDKSQREYYLQQQLRAIQKELGETDDRTAEIEELKQKIVDAGMPSDVQGEAERELDRLQRISNASPEHGVIRDYLDWLCQMPWNTQTADNLDLKRAERVLNEDHFGLDKIKKRILEYLAVRKLKPEGKGPILCFVGPPGVGKTSLGQSIARALGRKFIRMSLGGVRDEADIRGHRRTYIGAVPGRIVQEIRKAQSRNPVLMLDELDKLGVDFRGDPASALLEVLDPQQNHSFTDHYLSVPFDLSQVLFIGTANHIDPVPAALRDRMEVIELGGYTTAEKLEIAKRYLVVRQKQENGLGDERIRLTNETLLTLIEKHTRESGVRNLERTIGAVFRGLAAKVARNDKIPKTIKPDHLHTFVGPARFEREEILEDPPPGVATGMAYTPVGGEVIFVEAARMPGRGTFKLTGHVGDVMRESAEAALSLVRSRGSEWKISPRTIRESDIHIHVPAGGTPKDGPSAGVAMLTALVSLFSQRPVDPHVSMTGEITLRGRVLPVGGIKEKVLAAHRAGVRTVVVPARNRHDLDELPADVRDELRFVLADRVEDALRTALPNGNGRKRSRKKATKTTKGSAARRSRRRSIPRG